MKTAKTKSSVAPARKESAFFSKDSDQDPLRSADKESTFFSNKTYSGSPVQTKLSIGKANDVYEKEADAVADKVVQRLAATEKMASSDSSIPSKPIGSSITSLVQTKGGESEKEEKLQKKDEEESKEKSINRKAIFESNAEPEDEVTNLQRKENISANETASPSIEKKLSNGSASGNVLPQNINQSMSNAIGSDFSNVKIHSDSNAAQMSKDLNAQAFTHGNDIYFNSGKYDTNTTAGKHLLAHELTHTVQQGTVKGSSHSNNGTAQRLPAIQKDGNANATPAPASKIAGPPYVKDGYKYSVEKGLKVLTVPKVSLPAFKSRNSGMFKKDIAFMAGRIDSKQIPKWNESVTEPVSKTVDTFLQGKSKDARDGSYYFKSKTSDFVVFGKPAKLKRDFRIPDWDKDGKPRQHSVDHIVELQLGGRDDDTNYELLDTLANSTIGSVLQKEIYSRIKDGVKFFKDNDVPDVPAASELIKKEPVGVVFFTEIDKWDLKPSKGNPDAFWSIQSIKDGTALNQLQQMTIDEVHKLDGSDKKLHLFVKPGEGVPHIIELPAKKIVNWLPGVDLLSVNVSNPNAADETEMGTVSIALQPEVAKKLNAPSSIQIKFNKVTGLFNAGGLVFEGVTENLAKLFSFPGLSPITITSFDIGDNGLMITGIITAENPIIENAAIDFSVTGKEIRISKTFSSGEIKSLPGPVKITDISLSLFASTEFGFGVEGNIDYEIGTLGKGTLIGLGAMKDGFGVRGDFFFNSKKFKGSDVWFKYLKKEWSAGGSIVVTDITGVESAALKMAYEDKKIKASGLAKFKVPGLDSATFNAMFDNDGGLDIKTKVVLKKLPGVKSGSVDVEVSKKKDDPDYSLSVTGEAEPNLPKVPNVSTKLLVSYVNGLFKAEATAKFDKPGSLITGADLKLGITNGTVVDGLLTPGEGGSKISYYGSGSLTFHPMKGADAAITVILDTEGKAKFSADFSITATPFPTIEGTVPILDITKEIPLAGVPFLTINASIKLGASLYANWKPLTLKVTGKVVDKTYDQIIAGNFGAAFTIGAETSGAVGLKVTVGVGGSVTAAVLVGGARINGSLSIEANGGLKGTLDATWDGEKGLKPKKGEASAHLDLQLKPELSGEIFVDLDLIFKKSRIWTYEKKLAEGKPIVLYALDISSPFEFNEDGSMKDFDPAKIKFTPPLDKKVAQDQGEKASGPEGGPDTTVSKEDVAKENIKKEISKAFRVGTKEQCLDIYRYADDLRNKYTSVTDVSLRELIMKTIDAELRQREVDEFFEFKNVILNSRDTIDSKHKRIDIFGLSHLLVAPEIASLHEEVNLQAIGPVQKKSIFESEADENSLQKKSAHSGSSDDNSIADKLNSSGGNGTALPESVRKDLQPSFKSNLSDVNIHTDQKAAQMSEALNAQAFTKGNSIYFNKGKFNPSNKEGKHLLAHELTHVDQQVNNTNGSAPAISRHPVEQTDVARKERIDLFGDGTAIKPGIEFEKFESYTRRQADWFAAPSLSVADRANLWRLLFISTEGGFVLAGTRGLLLSALIPLSAAEWDDLKAFGRACHSGMNTVRIASAIAYTLPQRLRLGASLLELEKIIPKEVLEFTVTEEQLKDIEAKPALLPQLSLYWFLFQPTLQQKDNKSPGRNREFQQILDLIGTAFGIFPYLSLIGRVRNLHRFTTATLDRLVINFNDTSHSKPLQLVLHSPHDSPASFASDQPLIANLVANLDTLVLMLEGMGSLADITAEIPKIASTYGKADAKGIKRIARVMISGHGETRNVSLAGTGAANAAGDKIEYPSESLDLDDAKQAKATQDLLDALLNNLDPATAKIVFNGCLVGSNIIPPGTPTADIPKYIAAHPNLKTFTESRAAALKLGMPADLVQGARASLATPDSLMDAKGNLEIKFKDDPDVFGTAAAYVATGHEPEGLIRSAIELAAIDPVAAAVQLRLRKAKGVAKVGDWWEDVTVALVEMALDGLAVGAPVSLARLHTLSSFAQTIFLVRFDFGISVSHFTSIINTDPILAPIVYAKIAATNSFTAATDDDAKNMRMIVEQARIDLGQPREADLINFIGNTIPISQIENHLDVLTLAAKSSAFFPLGALSPGKIRLAIAWIRNDKTNADVVKFLDNEVTVTPAGPAFSADVQAELVTAGIPERDILELIGRIGAVPPPKGVKPKAEKDKANAELNGDSKNDAYVVGKPYVATVIPTIYALNVRRLPSMAGKPFAWLHPGDKVNVMGFVHEWAAIDQNGHLGFVYKTKISAPPP